MPDMPIKLYDLEEDWSLMAAQKEQGIAIRKQIGPEAHIIVKRDFILKMHGSIYKNKEDPFYPPPSISSFQGREVMRLPIDGGGLVGVKLNRIVYRFGTAQAFEIPD